MSVIKQFPIEKEYLKNPDISPEDIAKLRDWLKTQPHLPAQHFDDLLLMLVFHCCERSQEVSKQVLDLHFTLRTLFTTYFKERSVDSRVAQCLDTILIAPLPTPTLHGYRAVYVRLIDTDPRKFDLNNGLKMFMMVLDLWQYEEGTWPGFVLIIDLDKVQLGHLGRIEINTIRDLLYFLQECVLVKLKEIHFLNAPSFMDKIMMLLRPFMKKELLAILNIHQSNSEKLYEFVPKEALPKDCGGSYKDFVTLKEETKKRLYANEELLKSDCERRVQEALRPGGRSRLIDQFGVQGSFKKLDLD